MLGLYGKNLGKEMSFKDWWDDFVYLGLCIASCGGVYLIRLVITTAIKKAK